MPTNVSPDIAARTIQYVQLSSALGKRAMDALRPRVQSEKKAADAAPAVLDALLSAGMIRPDQKEAAAAALGDHAATLAVLKNAADRFAEQARQKSASLGAGVEEPKAASAYDPNSSLSSPFVGARTSQKKASDLALFRGLGLDVNE